MKYLQQNKKMGIDEYIDGVRFDDNDEQTRCKRLDKNELIEIILWLDSEVDSEAENFECDYCGGGVGRSPEFLPNFQEKDNYNKNDFKNYSNNELINIIINLREEYRNLSIQFAGDHDMCE